MCFVFGKKVRRFVVVMAIESAIDFSGLNPAQNEAVRCINGPSLIIAGAGSGKTKVLTYKIAYLLEQGIAPRSILALTFTNKASKEMKERIGALVGREKSARLWMGTFHSIFSRFLRQYADKLGYPSSFTIYDSSDTKSALRACIKQLELDEKVYKPSEVQSRISFAKNNLVTATAYINNAQAVKNDMAVKKGRICDIYLLYEKNCKAAGVMDFDDILLNMNILLRDNPDVCDTLRSDFKYILVDEYQDTNYAQYLIVKKLSSLYQNITVVGDDSQSIYGFRGARIQNILNFKKDYPQAKEFLLERNYRSTQTIVKAANSVIAHNSNRLRKECFSQGPTGDKIEVLKAFTEQEEGSLVASSIAGRIYSSKASYDQFAVLYRTNAQSRVIEEMLRKRNLPYKIFAGHSFYERSEVKDILAYFRLIVNPKDDEAFRRAVNTPARGIGETSVGYLAAAAKERNISLWEALSLPNLGEFGLKAAAYNKMAAFAAMINSLSAKAADTDAYDLASETANVSGLVSALRAENTIESLAKIDNIEELLASVNEFVEETTASEEELGNEVVLITLQSYLENVALMTEIDASEDKNDDGNKISLMTVHTSKGLEFDYVYIVGMEENLFPSSISSTPDEVEEERRLFYVALTRAKSAAAVSYCRSRFRWGQYVNYPPSRFLKEIDPMYLSAKIGDDESGSAVGSSRGFGGDSDEEYGWSRFGSPASSGRYGGNSGGSGHFGGGSGKYPYRNGGARHDAPQEKVSLPQPTLSRPVRQSDPNFTPDPISNLRVGQKVEHDRFGYGTIESIEGQAPNAKAIVNFEIGGSKTLLLKFAKLKIVQ